MRTKQIAENGLPLPNLRGSGPPWAIIARRLVRRWRWLFPQRQDGTSLRTVLGLPERRQLTAEELIELRRKRDEERECQKRERAWRKEAQRFALKASETLDTPCGISHVVQRGTKSWTQRVTFFTRCSNNGNIVYLKADTAPGHFPHNHDLSELRSAEVIEIVSANLGREIVPWRSHYNGGGYFVYRNIGAEGFPLHVAYGDMWEKYQPASIAKDNWAVPLGLSYNAKPWWRSVPDLGHILIAGTPGYGKSNLANQLICSLIEHNAPWQMQFLFVDFKGGIEFKFYKGLPHIRSVPKMFIRKKKVGDDDLPESVEEEFEVTGEKEEVCGIIDKPFLMPGLLYWLNREAHRRFGLMADAGDVKSLGQYNQWAHLQGRAPLPRLIVWIDEWAVIHYTRSIGPVCTDLLTKCGNLARVAGIQFVICTQHPNREVLPGAMIATTDTRFVFRITDQYMSRSLLGNDKAINLDNKGRCYANGAGIENVELQVPFISNEVIKDIVAASTANEGKIDASRRRGLTVSAEEIWKWALEENKGFLGNREIFEYFRTRGMTQKQVAKFLQNYEGDLVTIGERQYRVAPESDFPNRTPRRLLAVGDDEGDEGVRLPSPVSSNPPTEPPQPQPDLH